MKSFEVTRAPRGHQFHLRVEGASTTLCGVRAFGTMNLEPGVALRGDRRDISRYVSCNSCLRSRKDG